MSGVDLGRMPCPERRLDGMGAAPLNFDAWQAGDGVVRLAFTATAPVVLGVREVAVPVGIALPPGIGPAPQAHELDVRFVPVERVLVDVAVAFAEQVISVLSRAVAQEADHA